MNGSDDSLRRAQLEFQGQMIAGATHEFQNHFAVIKEYSGLIGDLLQAGATDDNRVNKRCAQISRSITERANSASEAMSVLNRFSHRADKGVDSFRADEAAEEVVALMQQAASRLRISLKAARSGRDCSVRNDPALCQFLLYLSLSPVLDSLEEGGKAGVSVSKSGNGSVEIGILVKGSMPGFETPDPMRPGPLALCLEKTGGSLEVHPEKRNRRQIVITIPLLREKGG